MIPHLPAIRAYRRSAHLVIPHRAETPLARNVTKIGGFPYLLEHERWPVCARCQQPLTFIFQLSFGDLAASLHLGRFNFLLFYYCLECCPRASNDSGGHFLQLRHARAQDILQPAHFALRREEADAPDECAVVLRPIEDLPPPETVVGIIGADAQTVEEYERYVAALRGGNMTASKIGGYPFWIQAEPSLRCRCGAGMRFFAQIESSPEANLFWENDGVLYVLCCSRVCTPESLGFVVQSE